MSYDCWKNHIDQAQRFYRFVNHSICACCQFCQFRSDKCTPRLHSPLTLSFGTLSGNANR